MENIVEGEKKKFKSSKVGKDKWLIVSDIHSNIEALNACIDFSKTIQYDRFACLGDLVGYGPNPNEVVAWAIAQKASRPDSVFIMGNHDLMISDSSLSLFGYNPSAREAIESQRKILNDTSKEFLLSLKENVIVDDLHFTHGSPCQWDEYISNSWDAQYAMGCINGNTCFIGHTHRPEEWLSTDGFLKIINVGSVGQPRDGDPRSCTALYDSVTKSVEFFRVEYDIKAVQTKMEAINSPKRLIERLETGN